MHGLVCRDDRWRLDPIGDGTHVPASALFKLTTEFSGKCIVLCHEVEHSRPGLLILCEHQQQLAADLFVDHHAFSLAKGSGSGRTYALLTNRRGGGRQGWLRSTPKSTREQVEVRQTEAPRCGKLNQGSQDGFLSLLHESS